MTGVVSASLWDSEKICFAGMFTVLDIIHLIQYYYRTTSYEDATADVETVRLESLRRTYSSSRLFYVTSDKAATEIEKSLGVAPVPLIHEHPSSPIYVAAKRLIETHARRLPLLDYDTESGLDTIISILTQYRLLKFVAINVGFIFFLFYSMQKRSHISPVREGHFVSSHASSKTRYWDICRWIT